QIVRREYGLRRIGELEKSAHGRLPATESEVAIDHETAVELDTSDLQCSPKTAILIQATIAPTTGARERTRYHPDSGKALFDEVHRGVKSALLRIHQQLGYALDPVIALDGHHRHLRVLCYELFDILLPYTIPDQHDGIDLLLE